MNEQKVTDRRAAFQEPIEVRTHRLEDLPHGEPGVPLSPEHRQRVLEETRPFVWPDGYLYTAPDGQRIPPPTSDGISTPEQEAVIAWLVARRERWQRLRRHAGLSAKGKSKAERRAASAKQ